MSPALRALASLRLTLGLLLALAILGALGSVVPQGLPSDQYRTRYPESAKIILSLGLDRYYTGPVYRGLLGLFTLNLLVCAAGRSADGWRGFRGRGRAGARTPAESAAVSAEALRARGLRVSGERPLRASRHSWAFLGFPAVHLALPVVTAGALGGSVAGFVGTQNVYVGDSTPTVYDWSALRDRPLPFRISAEDFRLLHYPVQVRIDILDAPERQEADLRVGGVVPVDGTQYRVRVESFDPESGDMVYFVETPEGPRGPFSRNREEGAPVRVRPLAFRDPEVRRAEAVVALKDAEGRPIARQTVAVNEPIVHGGLRIYLTAWDRDPYGNPFVGFQVVRDPGQPLVWGGSVLLCLGLLALLFGDGAWVREEGGEIACRSSRGVRRARQLLGLGGGGPTGGASPSGDPDAGDGARR